MRFRRTHPQFFGLTMMFVLLGYAFARDMLLTPQAWSAPAFSYHFQYLHLFVYGWLFIVASTLLLVGSFSKFFLVKIGYIFTMFLYVLWGMGFLLAYINDQLSVPYPIAVYAFLSATCFLASKEPSVNPASSR